MNCPRCRTRVPAEQNTCSACGFTARVLHGYLGNQWVRLERITDAAHCLRLEEVRGIEVLLDDFERHFPQAFFATYLGILPNGLNAAELGFWLLNQGAFNTHSVSRRNDFGIVLVVDPAAQTASMTLGYAIEALFAEHVTSRILSTTGSHLSKGAYGMASEDACNRCADALRKKARAKLWQPDIPVSGVMTDMGLQTLRGGHKPASPPLPAFSNTRP